MWLWSSFVILLVARRYNIIITHHSACLDDDIFVCICMWFIYPLFSCHIRRKRTVYVFTVNAHLYLLYNRIYKRCDKKIHAIKWQINFFSRLFLLLRHPLSTRWCVAQCDTLYFYLAKSSNIFLKKKTNF